MSYVKSSIIIDKLIESFGLFLSVYIHSCFRPKAKKTANKLSLFWWRAFSL